MNAKNVHGEDWNQFISINKAPMKMLIYMQYIHKTYISFVMGACEYISIFWHIKKVQGAIEC